MYTNIVKMGFCLLFEKLITCIKSVLILIIYSDYYYACVYPAMRYTKNFYTFIFAFLNTYFSFSSLHCKFSNRVEKHFIPESLSVLLLRSSSIRFEGFDIKAEARADRSSSLM